MCQDKEFQCSPWVVKETNVSKNKEVKNTFF